jgi:hypothetical protein
VLQTRSDGYSTKGSASGIAKRWRGIILKTIVLGGFSIEAESYIVGAGNGFMG